MSKLPSLQFYPGDWRKDIGVQSLSFHDRGVWFEILMLMHESDQRGLLTLNALPMPEEALARILGLDKQILTTTLTNLLTSGVASREQESGALMCRRMVRDEKLRQVRTEAGKMGGNPTLLNQKPTTGDNQNSTPSSSSSSSSTKQIHTPDSKPKNQRKPKTSEVCQTYADSWNANCGNLPKVSAVSDDRVAKLDKRIEAGMTLEAFTQAVKLAVRTPYLRGENDRNWVCTFDFFLSKENRWIKVLEGGYGAPDAPKKEWVDVTDTPAADGWLNGGASA